jgi:hypothetical protein
MTELHRAQPSEGIRCAWCRVPIVQSASAGRPRRFCTQACRQWDWVSRQRASELQLSEDELVVIRSKLHALRDQIYVLQCAVRDVEHDLDPANDPTSRDFKAALVWILAAAQPLTGDLVLPSSTVPVGIPRP